MKSKIQQIPGERHSDWKDRWEGIYSDREPAEISWYQAHPEYSLGLIGETDSGSGARIIDVGGGASTLVDHLIDTGYPNVTVLDISTTAILQARARLGDKSDQVTWLEGDIRDFSPDQPYDIWHDRAVFHFLTHAEDRAAYVEVLNKALKPGGHAIIATFSENGPSRCNGLDVVRYRPADLGRALGPSMRLVETLTEEHRTPGGGIQEFVYCRFCRSE